MTGGCGVDSRVDDAYPPGIQALYHCIIGVKCNKLGRPGLLLNFTCVFTCVFRGCKVQQLVDDECAAAGVLQMSCGGTAAGAMQVVCPQLPARHNNNNKASGTGLSENRHGPNSQPDMPQQHAATPRRHAQHSIASPRSTSAGLSNNARGGGGGAWAVANELRAAIGCEWLCTGFEKGFRSGIN